MTVAVLAFAAGLMLYLAPSVLVVVMLGRKFNLMEPT